MPAASKAPSPTALVTLPPVDDWRTTDQDEINRRRLRAREEAPQIVNREPRFPVYSGFDVHSPSGVKYSAEIRDLRRRQFSCECVDSRVNGLGTCKHIEAVLDHLETAYPDAWRAALEKGSPRVDLVPDREAQTLRVEHGLERVPRTLKRLFDKEGRIAGGFLPDMVLELWRQAAQTQPELRVSQEVAQWLECRKREAEAVALRRAYEHNVQSGTWPAQETVLPLFPYQREGMLHLACVERALLADEMGLGKTVQAVAASALLRRLGRAERVLIVTAASLKGEWEEQIERFTRFAYQSPGSGTRAERLAAYDRASAPFFTIVNYEQMLTDSLEVNERLRPEVIILDEAQRIKNWNTKTAMAVKRLQSRYAWVLTGTPLENHIDELYSLVSFLDPTVFGPLFRFNREFYEFDERGRPRGYKNLDILRERIRPLLLRRRKADVKTELPHTTERTFLVPMTESQRTAYATCEASAAKLLASNHRRPLQPGQRERLMRELNTMRILCDTPYILNGTDRTCPKLDELGRILSECMSNPEVKVIIFSEWERMLELVGGLCRRLRIEFASHTTSVSPGQRRAEIQKFLSEKHCRVLLSTDTGGPNLSLRNASVVIHCDYPWTSARLEQRMSRVQQQDQAHPVTVLNLISERTIEQRMLASIASKHALSDSVIDRRSDVNLADIKLLGTASDGFIQHLETLMPGSVPATASPARTPASNTQNAPVALRSTAKSIIAAPGPIQLPEDRPRSFCQKAVEVLNGSLVACEERFPARGEASVLFVVVESETDRCRALLEPLERQFFTAAPGKEAPPAVCLEVMDRPTAELLRRLAESGVVSPSLRTSRVLYPPMEQGAAPVLSPQEQTRAKAARDQHARRLKMARVLAAEEMTEEARGALTNAIHDLGRALAVERHLPEPSNAVGAIAPPLDACWPGGEPTVLAVRTFLADESAPLDPVMIALGQPLETGANKAREFFAGIKAKIANMSELPLEAAPF